MRKLNELRMEEAKTFKQSMDEQDITTTAIEESKRHFDYAIGQIKNLFKNKLDTKNKLFY